MEKREKARVENQSKTRRGAKPKRNRNTWPSPKIILDLLREKDISARQLCKELGIGYYTIACYRREDPLFAAEYDKIIQESELKRAEENPNYKTLKEIVSPDNWKARFLHEFARSFKKEAARIFAGVDAVVVEDSLDPASTEYDKEFCEKFRSLCISKKWVIEDTLWGLAIGDGEVDGKTQQTMFRDLLRMEFPESFGKQSVLVNNGVIGISGGAHDKAAAFLHDLFAEVKFIDVESKEIDDAE